MTTVGEVSAASVSRGEARRTAWLRSARLWAVVACFAVAGIGRSVQVDVPFRDPDGAYFVSRVFLTLWIFLGLVVLDGLLRTGRPLGVRRVLSTIRGRWTPTRICVAWSGLLAYHVTHCGYHTLKSWDVFNAPRDATLIRWDRWLFLGHSPAVLLHDLLGQDVAARVLLAWYEMFP